MTATPCDKSSLPPLLELLQHQAALFEQLDKLSVRQSDAVTDGDGDELLQILSTRQRFTDELTLLQESLEPVRRDWPKVRAGLDGPASAQVVDLLERSGKLFQRILERDERDSAALSAALDRVGADLAKLNRAGKARAAYGGPEAGANRYTNTQG